MRELVSLSAVASCVLSVIAVVNCFSTGAPTAACDHIYPEGHNGDSLDLTTNPFQLSLSDFNESYGGDIYYVPGKQYNCESVVAKHLTIWDCKLVELSIIR